MESKRFIVPYEVDEMFDVPEDVIGLTHGEYVETEEWAEENDEFDVIDDTMEATDAPEVPTGFTVVQQIVRFGPDGSQVVDLVLDVEDIEEIVKYDVRVTKYDN